MLDQFIPRFGIPKPARFWTTNEVSEDEIGLRVGKGFYHHVFQHAYKPDKVIKLPINWEPIIPTRSPLLMSLFNTWVAKFFTDFYLPTTIHMNIDHNQYAIEQAKYTGRVFRRSDLTDPLIADQFDAIMAANRLMVSNTGFSMDFQGFDMFVELQKNRFNPSYDPGLSNIVVTHDPDSSSAKLLVTDYDLLNASRNSIKISSLRSSLILGTSFLAQNTALTQHFGQGLH